MPEWPSNSVKGGILLFLLFLLSGLALQFFFRPPREGFDTTLPLQILNPTTINNPTTYVMTASEIQNGWYITQRDENGYATQKGQLPFGYYKSDATHMKQVPYGYTVKPQKQYADVNELKTDKTDYMTLLVPKTITAQYEVDPAHYANGELRANASASKIPANEKIPDGFYRLDETHMAILPPGMKPNITQIDIAGTVETPLLVETYGTGYVPESAYYSKKYTVSTSGGDCVKPSIYQKNSDGSARCLISATLDFPGSSDTTRPLPTTLYYSNVDNLSTWSKNMVQYLPYGKKANLNTPGYIDDPKFQYKGLSFDTPYTDISSNYDVVFHDTIDDIKKQNDMYDMEFGAITVKDKDGNLVTLPRSKVQGDITYYTPGAYTFGASSYVPKYEDSVYLSRTSQMPTMAEYTSAFKPNGFCDTTGGSAIDLESKCNSLDKDVCASTTCCVLLGGSKCVAGNDRGPTWKQNYGDVFVRNHDYYTHKGKCYGNCP